MRWYFSDKKFWTTPSKSDIESLNVRRSHLHINIPSIALFISSNCFKMLCNLLISCRPLGKSNRISLRLYLATITILCMTFGLVLGERGRNIGCFRREPNSAGNTNSMPVDIRADTVDSCLNNCVKLYYGWVFYMDRQLLFYRYSSKSSQTMDRAREVSTIHMLFKQRLRYDIVSFHSPSWWFRLKDLTKRLLIN